VTESHLICDYFPNFSFSKRCIFHLSTSLGRDHEDLHALLSCGVAFRLLVPFHRTGSPLWVQSDFLSGLVGG
jgi:hypothetical protein